MGILSLVLLLSTTASAFVPSALPPPSSQLSINTTPSWSSSPLSPCKFVVPSRNFSKQSGINHVRASPRLSMAAATAAAEQQKPSYKKRIATFMAFMTGWADVLFIKKFSFFGTMMTGNSLKMADAFVGGRVTDALFYASIICSYIFGVGTYRRAEITMKDKALNCLFAPIVAACFIWSDYLSWLDPTFRFAPATLLAFSWGIINSVGSEVTGTLIFVVTGAMTRISNMLVDRISRTAGRKKIPKDGFLMSSAVIWGFIAGCAWSSFLLTKAPKYASRGAFSIIGGVYGLLFLWLDREQMGAWWSKENGKLCEIDADEVDCK